MNKKILRLAIPNILSNITVPLLSSVDTAVMGHLESPVYLGAIALGSMIFHFIYWSFGFLRMGTTGLAAQAFGSKNNVEVSSILYRSVLISSFIGLVLIGLQYPIAEIKALNLLCRTTAAKQFRIVVLQPAIDPLPRIVRP